MKVVVDIVRLVSCPCELERSGSSRELSEFLATRDTTMVADLADISRYGLHLLRRDHNVPLLPASRTPANGSVGAHSKTLVGVSHGTPNASLRS